MRRATTILLILFTSAYCRAQVVFPIAPSHSTISFDSIVIEKNWRTRNRIVQRLLQLPPSGDHIKRASVDSAMIRLWNTDNFVCVNYRTEINKQNKKILYVVAKDKFTLVPILELAGNKENYRMGFGLEDENLLGKNIQLYSYFGLNSNGSNFDFKLRIPKELLPKNMELSLWASFGKKHYAHWRKNIASDWVAFHKREAMLWFGNPNQREYSYGFSPNFGIAYHHHITDRSILEDNLNDYDFVPDYDSRFLEFRLSENVGTVNKQRHRKQGYNLELNMYQAFALHKNDENFHTLQLSGEGHYCTNDWLQLSTKLRVAYTSSSLASFHYYLGPGIFKGINTGQVSGSSYYYLYTGAHITWVNREWLALEQGVFINWGYGSMSFVELLHKKPTSAIGTSFSFHVPMISFLRGTISLSYTLTNTNEYSVYF